MFGSALSPASSLCFLLLGLYGGVVHKKDASGTVVEVIHVSV